MSTTVGFSPVAPGNGVVSGGTTAAAGTGGGDSPLGFLDALLAMLAQGTALTAQGQNAGTDTGAGEGAANAGVDLLAGLGVAAETAITTQLPAVDAPVVPEAAGESAFPVDGEQLLEDLVAALTAIEDAADSGQPIDPALHKKLSETIDDLAGMLGITLPTSPAVDPAITVAAGGDVAIELEATSVGENAPLPPGFTLDPVGGETTTSADLATKIADAVAQATTPAPVDEPEQDAQTAVSVETEIDPERRQVVRPARLLAPFKRDGRIWSKRRLHFPSLRHFHPTARLPQ